jgi:WD40 repeat protein
MVARLFKGYASLEVTRQREVATDLTFLTGLTHFDPLSQVSQKMSKVHSYQYRGGNVWYMKFAFDADYTRLAVGTTDGKIFIWNIADDDPAKHKHVVLRHRKCVSHIRQVCFTPDGRALVAACDDGSLWVWRKI